MTARPSDFRLNILGCGSAVPTPLHNPSSQVIERRGCLYMIDCGEGAQAMIRRMKLKFSRLRHIFISHLHGDHVFGLPGLLSTLALTQTGGDVTVHMFREGIELLEPLVDFFARERTYVLRWNPIDPAGGETLVDTGSLKVTTFRLNHRVPCVGFRFDEAPKPRHLIAEMLDFHGVGVAQRAAIRAGADFVREDGTVIANALLTRPADPSASYAYCSDTMFDPEVAEAVRGVSLLYHEATYGDEFTREAATRGHSTARQAAEIARMAGVGELVIGHYSKRYTDISPLLDEARQVFGRVIAAREGMVIDVPSGEIISQTDNNCFKP